MLPANHGWRDSSSPLLGDFGFMALVFAILMFVSSPSLSRKVLIRDQHGQPLENAVLMVPGVPADLRDEPTVVDQIDREFVPRVLAVATGQYVNFPNSDSIRHHVYSFSKSNPFEIRLYSGKPAKPIQFQRPGVVVMGCNIHDYMTGYLFVSDDWAASSGKDGLVQLPESDLPSELGLWHPRQVDAIDDIHYQKLSGENAPDSSVVKSLLKLTIHVRPPKSVVKKATFKSRFSQKND